MINEDINSLRTLFENCHCKFEYFLHFLESKLLCICNNNQRASKPITSSHPPFLQQNIRATLAPWTGGCSGGAGEGGCPLFLIPLKPPDPFPRARPGLLASETNGDRDRSAPQPSVEEKVPSLFHIFSFFNFSFPQVPDDPRTKEIKKRVNDWLKVLFISIFLLCVSLKLFFFLFCTLTKTPEAEFYHDLCIWCFSMH